MSPKPGAATEDKSKISSARAGRLYRLLRLAAGKDSIARPVVLKKLRVGMRTFYRDLDLLRACGIAVTTHNDGYSLGISFEQALALLPFPDPELTFGDILNLMKGRSASHQKLRKLIDQYSQ